MSDGSVYGQRPQLVAARVALRARHNVVRAVPLGGEPCAWRVEWEDVSLMPPNAALQWSSSRLKSSAKLRHLLGEFSLLSARVLIRTSSCDAQAQGPQLG